MNSIDEQLKRLFRAAAQIPAHPMSVPYGLETRVMAAWRASGRAEAGLLDMTLLVKAMVVACLIMTVSFWPAFNTTTNPFAEFLQLTDSTVSSDDSP